MHKSERFLRPGVTAVATTYGPVCFGKAPCLLLRQKDNGIPDLVAMGSFLSSDPTRIIAKRIILTGHPFKVHKKTATIRYMFFDREDVEYFQTVELHTKHGRTGHIKEALGTHGYFKAHFDGPIQQMDTICMSLYKRQYPKVGRITCILTSVVATVDCRGCSTTRGKRHGDRVEEDVMQCIDYTSGRFLMNDMPAIFDCRLAAAASRVALACCMDI